MFQEFLDSNEKENMSIIINSIKEDHMMALFNFCKMQSKLDKFIENLSVDKMNPFFEEC